MTTFRRRNFVHAGLAISFGVVGASVASQLQGCDGETDPGEFDQNAMLANIAQNVIMPALTKFEAEAAALESAVAALESTADVASLSSAREAWGRARSAWKQCQAFAFGPFDKITPTIDWWPADTADIDSIVASGGPFDAAFVDGLGTSKKGMSALEYLLFDPEATDADIAARLVDAAGSFARALGENLSARATELRAAWDPAEGAHATAFAEAGTSSAVYKSPKDALDAVVNEIVYLADTAANHIADPLGLKNGGTIAPELEESRRSDHSLRDIEDRLRGIDAVWEGRYGDTDGLGISDMVASRSESLAGDVRATIDAAFAAIEAVPGTLRASLEGAPAALQTAFDDLIAVKRVLGSDVVTVLGVTLTFNDNDGD